ncbi:hypothetical protein HY025_00720 [Candidatus Daviesbacteria bacterium]|nr:hypothetical protein [Candidatus Daviesbacteria bacterium]
MKVLSQGGFISALVLFILVFGIAIGVYLVENPTFFIPKAENPPFPNTIYTEAPEKAFGPDARLSDAPFTTSYSSSSSATLLGYFASGQIQIGGIVKNQQARTYLRKGADLNSLQEVLGHVVVQGGSGWDVNGAWILGPSYISTDRSKTINWYHAERPSSPVTIKSVGYIESTDGGETFLKPNYPNNQVLTGDNQFASDPGYDKFSAGDFKVIPYPPENPEYYYMYFRTGVDSDVPDGPQSLAMSLARGPLGNLYLR